MLSSQKTVILSLHSFLPNTCPQNEFSLISHLLTIAVFLPRILSHNFFLVNLNITLFSFNTQEIFNKHVKNSLLFKIIRAQKS